MKEEYISDLDFGIENPTKLICMCETPAEKITKVYVENLNDEISDYVKNISEKILKEINTSRNIYYL
jgi:hypothetical protein